MLAETLTSTVPLALPFRPDVTAIQPSPLVAVHPQPVRVVKATDSRPPPNPIASPLRLSPYRHAAAAWLSATVSEPTPSVVDRGTGTGFGATA
jgi:hypothetical protein